MEVLFHKFHDAPAVLKFVINELYEHQYYSHVVHLFEGSQQFLAKSPDILLLMRRTYLQLGDVEKAVRIEQQMASLHPHQVDTIRHRQDANK